MNYKYISLDFLLVLTIVFIILKVTNVIAWSWWLVFLPLFIEIGLLAITFIIMLIIAKKYGANLTVTFFGKEL